MQKIIYLDTSGLNYLADNIKDNDAFGIIKKKMGLELYLSPISLWEVLLNTNDERKDFLIYWAQFNCAPNLIKSPTEIVIDYINSNCPLKDRKQFFDDPHTKMEIGKTWTKIHKKIDRTIPIDIQEMKDRSKPIRVLSKKMKSIIAGMCDQSDPNYKEETFHKLMLVVLQKLKYTNTLDLKHERLFKISLIILFFVICLGFELQNKLLNDYWGKLNIDDPFERLDYLIENYPELMVRGPISEMAGMAEVQLGMTNSKSRGLFHDCFHTVYCYYSSNFITGDPHFQALRDTIKHPAFENIIMTEELEKIWDGVNKELTSHLNGNA